MEASGYKEAEGKYKLYLGDALDCLKEIESESIDCILTSPPYYFLRDYGVENQLGLEEDEEEYIWKLREIFREARRVLKKEGSLYLNIDDKYRNRSLLMIPEKLVIKMIEDGWILRNKIIWHKTNAAPETIQNRYLRRWEYIYFSQKVRNIILIRSI